MLFRSLVVGKIRFVAHQNGSGGASLTKPSEPSKPSDCREPILKLLIPIRLGAGERVSLRSGFGLDGTVAWKGSRF